MLGLPGHRRPEFEVVPGPLPGVSRDCCLRSLLRCARSSAHLRGRTSAARAEQIVRKGITALGVCASIQILPAATWLRPVRRLLPTLESPMAPGTTAITFDDGPHPDGTAAVLDELDQLGWSATFFMVGSAVARFPEVAREVVSRGHAVGLHGGSHRYLLGRTPLATSKDLLDAADVVGAATGVAPQWWRPPYGVLTAAGVIAAHRHRLHPLLWSAWGKDWRPDATAASIARTVRSGRLDGGTVLLHDSDAMSAPDSWKRTVAALPLIGEELAVGGLRVAPLPSRAPEVETVPTRNPLTSLSSVTPLQARTQRRPDHGSARERR
jgi:peptidoglycan/xylan/chitin deacetylase (PgdA/CDA1 family)